MCRTLGLNSVNLDLRHLMAHNAATFQDSRKYEFELLTIKQSLFS